MRDTVPDMDDRDDEGPVLPDAVAKGSGEWDYGPLPKRARWIGIDSPPRPRRRNVRDQGKLARHAQTRRDEAG